MKRKLLSEIMYLVILVLVLQVAKSVTVRIEDSEMILVQLIASSLQFLLITGYILFVAFRFWFSKMFKIKGTWPCLLLVAFLVTAAEILFSYWLYHPTAIPGSLRQAYRYYYFYYDYNILQFDESFFRYNKQLFYTLKPGVEGRFENAEFNTKIASNHGGFRDDDRSLVQPSVICLGDSFTFGWGVGQEEAFPQIVERSIGKTVINAGMPSYGTAREIISLAKIDQSKTEHLFVQFCTNDYGENSSFVQDSFHLTVSSEKEYKQTGRAVKLRRTYFPGKNFLMVGQIYVKQLINKIAPLFYFEDLPVKREPLNPQWVKTFLDILSKAPVDYAKVKTTVFQLDVREKMGSRFATIADSLLRTPPYNAIFHNNLRVIDFSTALCVEDFYSLDPHLKRAGHEKVARIICDQVLATNF